MTAKTEIYVKIELIVPIADRGYLGHNVPIEEHLTKATKDLSDMQFFVKQGGGEYKPCRVASRKLETIIITPKEGST